MGSEPSVSKRGGGDGLVEEVDDVGRGNPPQAGEVGGGFSGEMVEDKLRAGGLLFGSFGFGYAFFGFAQR